MIEKLKAIWNKFKTWFLKNWLLIVNYIVIFVAYSIVYDKNTWAELILGLWLFVSAAYGMYKWFIGKPKDTTTIQQ